MEAKLIWNACDECKGCIYFYGSILPFSMLGLQQDVDMFTLTFAKSFVPILAFSTKLFNGVGVGKGYILAHHLN